MISKMVKGSGFRGTLDYVLGKDQAELIGGTMAGRDSRELAVEFGDIRALRPSLGKAVFHVSLAVPKNEMKEDSEWRMIGDRYMREMGFDDNQYAIVRHKDTDHDHIHIVANRIKYDGSVVSDSRDMERSARVLQGIERDYGLRQVALTPQEARAIRGYKSQRVLWDQDIRFEVIKGVSWAAKNEKTMSGLVARLEEMGIGVKANIQSTGRVSGISFTMEGYHFKGSDLGRAYTWNSIQTRLGVQYEPNRDLQALRDASARADRFWANPEAFDAWTREIITDRKKWGGVRLSGDNQNPIVEFRGLRARAKRVPRLLEALGFEMPRHMKIQYNKDQENEKDREKERETRDRGWSR